MCHIAEERTRGAVQNARLPNSFTNLSIVFSEPFLFMMIYYKLNCNTLLQPGDVKTTPPPEESEKYSENQTKAGLQIKYS